MQQTNSPAVQHSLVQTSQQRANTRSRGAVKCMRRTDSCIRTKAANSSCMSYTTIESKVLQEPRNSRPAFLAYACLQSWQDTGHLFCLVCRTVLPLMFPLYIHSISLCSFVSGSVSLVLRLSCIFVAFSGVSVWDTYRVVQGLAFGYTLHGY